MRTEQCNKLYTYMKYCVYMHRYIIHIQQIHMLNKQAAKCKQNTKFKQRMKNNTLSHEKLT